MNGETEINQEPPLASQQFEVARAYVMEKHGQNINLPLTNPEPLCVEAGQRFMAKDGNWKLSITTSEARNLLRSSFGVGAESKPVTELSRSVKDGKEIVSWHKTKILGLFYGIQQRFEGKKKIEERDIFSCGHERARPENLEFQFFGN